MRICSEISADTIPSNGSSLDPKPYLARPLHCLEAEGLLQDLRVEPPRHQGPPRTKVVDDDLGRGEDVVVDLEEVEATILEIL
jgi:hypothetical protein